MEVRRPVAPSKPPAIIDDADFHYGTLAPNTIRLLRFLPKSTKSDMHVTFVDEFNYTSGKKPYIAISYCWGDQTDRRTITMNGCSFSITKNLWQALGDILEHHNKRLQHYQRYQSRYYWVDAICINQTDIEERNDQVHQMWRIYSGASEVYAYLGPDTMDFENRDRNGMMALFSGRLPLRKARVEDLQADYESYNESHNSDLKSGRLLFKPHYNAGEERGYDERAVIGFISDLRMLANSEYFRRTWIITEFLQASKLVFLVGPYRCEWDLLDASLPSKLPSAQGEAHLKLLRRLSKARRRNRDNLYMLHSIREETAIHDTASALYECILLYASSRCTDPRDRIFAMLGHPTVISINSKFEDPKNATEYVLKPDYSMTREELLVATLSWLDAIEERSLAGIEGAKTKVSPQEVASALGTALDCPGVSSNFAAWFYARDELFHFYQDYSWVRCRSGKVVNCQGRNLSTLIGRPKPS